jgi:hypothetical protein
MSLEVATWVTAVATVALAVFAVFTAVYARRAFLKQSQEVSDQGRMLKVQSDQLNEQRKLNEKQTPVLELQSRELRESLNERERERDDRKRSQAAGVVTWLEKGRAPGGMFAGWGAQVRNASDLPVFDVRAFFHLIRQEDGGGWVPVAVGGLPPDQTALVFPAGAERFVPLPENVEAMFGNIPVSEATCVASVEFTDAAGNHWERDPRGALNPRS